MRKLILLYVFLMFCTHGYGQMLAYYHTLSVDTLFYSDKDQSLKQVDFYFPSFGHYKSNFVGYKLPSKESKINLRKYSNASLSNPILFFRCYVKNIKNIRISISHGSMDPLIVNIPLKYDGYQVPFEISLDSSISEVENNVLLDFSISYESSDMGKQAELILEDLYLANTSLNKVLSPVPVFQDFPFSNAVNIEKKKLNAFDSYGIFKHFPLDQFEENYKGTILIEDDINSESISDNSAINAFILALMHNYPFFKERKLDKDSLISTAVALMERYQSASTCDLVDTLNSFLTRSFNDPHFGLQKSCSVKATYTPIYTYQFSDKFLVAAVLDEELESRIPLGSEVIAVNGVTLPASVFTRPNKMEQLLKKEKGEQVTIKVKKDNGVISDIKYTVKGNYEVPENFKPQNFSFKFLNDSVAYYRVSKITPFLQSDFLNKLDRINTRKKLIIDMRGNGGGDLISGAQFASYFIGHEFKYSDFINSGTNIRDSIIVNENKSPFLFREDGKIVILIDERTACASELIAMALKEHSRNVSIVGKSPSAGALAFVYELRMESSAVNIRTNGLNDGKFAFNNGSLSLEGVGIYPDVLVQVDRIQDLQPYDDKVLKIAISK